MISLNVVAALMALNFLPASAAAIQARALKPIPVHIYDDLKYGGNHEEWLVPYKECTSVPNGWNDRMRSFKVDQDSGDFMCTLYLHENCEGKGHSAVNDKDLSDGSGRHDKSVSSIYCYVDPHGLPAI